MYRYLIALVLAFGTSLPMAAFGQTPDGQTPAQENVCADLTGAAKGICNAYCEAQDCDEHERPSCERLRNNFEKKTGSRTLPCDRVVCGDSKAPACNGECPDDQVCTAHVNAEEACVCEPPPPVCAGDPCEGGGDCTTQFCDTSAGSPGVCGQVCADPSTTCGCGGDCTSGFCDDSGGSPGHCAPVCAGPGTTCNCGGDCTSGFCDESLGLPGQCAPVADGGQCRCGGDCLSGFCDDSLGLPGVCGGVD